MNKLKKILVILILFCGLIFSTNASVFAYNSDNLENEKCIL